MTKNKIGTFTPAEKAIIKNQREEIEAALIGLQNEVAKMADDYEEDGMIHNFEKMNQLLRRAERFQAMHTAVMELHIQRNTTEEEL